ncbi:MAG: zinc ribbon domain-containing protein [Phycisphaerales bacterium]|nr:zinc ribbon domain-containing protein [Phycisphaerales bacterium]
MKRTLVIVVLGAVAIVGAVVFKRGQHDQTVKGQMLDLVRQVQGSDIERRYLEAQVERFHAEVFEATAKGVDRSQFDRDAYTKAMFERLIADARDASKISLAMKLERFQQSIGKGAPPRHEDEDEEIESAWACTKCGVGRMLTAEQLDALGARTKEFLASTQDAAGAKPSDTRALLCEACRTVTVTPAMQCTRCSQVYRPTSKDLKGICPKCSVMYWICRNAACGHEFEVTLAEHFKTGRNEGPAKCPKCSGTDTVLGFRCAKCGRHYAPVGHDQPAACPHCGASTSDAGRPAPRGSKP